MAWNEPTLFVLGLFIVTALGCVLPIRIDEREDHIVFTIAASVDCAILGPRGLVLVWGSVVAVMPLLATWSVLARNRDRLGRRGAVRKVGFTVLTAFAVTVAFILANFVYADLFGRRYPVLVDSTANFALAGLVVLASWVGTMTVRVLSFGRRSTTVLREGLDPFDSALIPYLLPLMAGFPLLAVSVAMYRPSDPWPTLMILWWCFPLYGATAFELHRRRLAQELRRDAFAQQRLAAIGEISARIVHQSRHQVGLMGWSIHRLRTLAIDGPPEHVVAAQRELDALAQAKDRLSEMLASELLHEPSSTETHDSAVGHSDDAQTEKTSVLLNAVIAEVQAQLQTEADRAGIVFKVDIDALSGVRQVPGQLRDVVFNLVDNAIDAARSHIEVRVERINGRDGIDSIDEIRVCDDGPGLTERDAIRVFEPFYSTKSDGTGMGLAIAEALVGDLGGALRYERDAGTTSFVVTLGT